MFHTELKINFYKLRVNLPLELLLELNLILLL